MTPEIYIQFGGALLAVVCLILVTAFFVRKRQAGQTMMKVIAYQPLGAKKGIAAIKVHGEVLLVGITQNDIRLLKSLSEGMEGPDQGSTETVREIHDKLQKLRTIKDAMYARP